MSSLVVKFHSTEVNLYLFSIHQLVNVDVYLLVGTVKLESLIYSLLLFLVSQLLCSEIEIACLYYADD